MNMDMQFCWVKITTTLDTLDICDIKRREMTMMGVKID